MSQSSKPRSRKSKLIPRRSLDSEDENIYELQNDIDMEIIRQIKSEVIRNEYDPGIIIKSESAENVYDKKFTIEPKLNLPENIYDENCNNEPQLDTSINDYEFTANEQTKLSDSIEIRSAEPQLKFSIKVEVEELDEENINIKTEPKEVQVPEPICKENNSVEPPYSGTHKNVDDFVDHSEASLEEVIPELDDALYTYEGDTNDLCLEGDRISKTGNYADEFLAIEMRNRCGVLGQAQESTLLSQELATIFKHWKLWNACRNFNQEPLFYKCYICHKSWWYLGPFVEHVKCHDLTTSVMYLEKCAFRCNFVISNFRGGCETFIDTPGNCWRCGRPFGFHIKHDTDHSYKCTGCKKSFHTCIKLVDHEKTCIELFNSDCDCICNICDRIFKIREDLENHLVLSHSVRSDIPVIPSYKICFGCKKKYHNRLWHHCLQYGSFRYVCKTCLKGFPLKSLYKNHLTQAKKKVKCRLCNEILKWKCEEIPHYITHSKKFVSAHKCTKCTELYLVFNRVSMQKHMMMWHEQQYNVKRHTFELVLLPVRCMKNVKKVDLRLFDLANIGNSSGMSSRPDELEECVARLNDSNRELQEAVIDVSAIKIEGDHNYYDAMKEQDVNMSDEYMAVYNKFLENILGESSGQENQVKDEVTAPNEVADDDAAVSDGGSCDDNRLVIDTQALNGDAPNGDAPNGDASNGDASKSMEPEVILKAGRRRPRIYKCTKCDYKGIHRQYREHIAFVCTRQKRFKRQDTVISHTCIECNVSFPDSKSYVLHFTKHGYEQSQCPICLIDCGKLHKLMGHIHYHIVRGYIKVKVINSHNTGTNSILKLKCKECNATVHDCDMFSHWVKHFRVKGVKDVIKSTIKHTKKIDQTALIPGRILKDDMRDEFLYKLMWIGHHHVDQRVCTMCKRTFSRLNDSKRHFIEHLLVDAFATKMCYNGFRCQICGDLFQKVDVYKRHMRDHASLPIYKCELCNKTFSDSSNFVKHKKVHNLEAVVCDICKKKFQVKASLEKHIKMHAVMEPILCEQCDKVFYSESSYRKHHRNTHEKRAPQFRCQFCGLYFPSLKQKWDHLWVIHNERKHKADCPVCTQKFRKFQDVKAHMRTCHSAEFKRWQRTSRPGSDDNICKFIRNNLGTTVGENDTYVVNAL